ncbi:pyridoxamine 5'-phosphate oxidase family protein [Sphaerochaeta sp.]|uniref:pyridoxamine 5'-phosphate oxidase family protein n=1 Tax=Sphaerochaeta sp. TaxID=1972642 RepID=UPI002FCABE93
MMPEIIKEAWNRRQKAVVLSTVDAQGMPNSIYVTCISLYEDTDIVVADNYFCKTKQNVEAGTKASVLFITDDNISYQLKGTVSYHTEGPYFTFMKAFNPAKHPGHGALVLHGQEIYSGAKSLH